MHTNTLIRPFPSSPHPTRCRSLSRIIVACFSSLPLNSGFRLILLLLFIGTRMPYNVVIFMGFRLIVALSMVNINTCFAAHICRWELGESNFVENILRQTEQNPKKKFHIDLVESVFRRLKDCLFSHYKNKKANTFAAPLHIWCAVWMETNQFELNALIVKVQMQLQNQISKKKTTFLANNTFFSFSLFIL